MRPFLKRLLLASHWGATLVAAGCTGSVATGGAGAGSAATGGAATGSGGGATGTGAQGSTQSLAPLPDLGCYGQDYGINPMGMSGQCCDSQLCVAPSGGVCPDAGTVYVPHDICCCLCTAADGQPTGTRGPYANPDASSPETCCYLQGSRSCYGRPLIVDGRPRFADVEGRPSSWSSTQKGTPGPGSHGGARRELAAAIVALGREASALPAGARARVADEWITRARFEHASVASFGRFALALLSLGAPPELCEAAHRAAIDEIDHARICLSIASAYAGEPLAFGPLCTDGALADLGSLEAVALATVIEGCVGETMAAIEAAEASRLEAPRAVQAALCIVAEDEARHAELAWAFVRWALGTAGPALGERVARAFEEALADATMATGGGQDLPAGHGLMPAAEVARLRRRVAEQVIRPAAAALGGAPAEVSSV